MKAGASRDPEQMKANKSNYYHHYDLAVAVLKNPVDWNDDLFLKIVRHLSDPANLK
jgi:hypothetical protein